MSHLSVEGLKAADSLQDNLEDAGNGGIQDPEGACRQFPIPEKVELRDPSSVVDLGLPTLDLMPGSSCGTMAVAERVNNWPACYCGSEANGQLSCQDCKALDFAHTESFDSDFELEIYGSFDTAASSTLPLLSSAAKAGGPTFAKIKKGKSAPEFIPHGSIHFSPSNTLFSGSEILARLHTAIEYAAATPRNRATTWPPKTSDGFLAFVRTNPAQLPDLREWWK
jgi:hypothetical protein